MAVPKRKTTPSKKRMRSSNKKVAKINISYDKVTGEPKLAHHISKDGYYNERVVLKIKEESQPSKENPQ